MVQMFANDVATTRSFRFLQEAARASLSVFGASWSLKLPFRRVMPPFPERSPPASGKGKPVATL